VEQLNVSRAIMDSLANYASDGDNSNNSDDVKVSEREDARNPFVVDVDVVVAAVSGRLEIVAYTVARHGSVMRTI